MAESGRIPVPLRLCRGCRRFVCVDGLETCAFCGSDLDAAEAEHEANVMALRQAAQALREALASGHMGSAPKS